MSSNRMKNFRRRSEEDDVNGDEKGIPRSAAVSSTSNTTTRSQSLTSAKSKASKSEGPKRLSFADDDEEEIPAVAPTVRSASRTPVSGGSSVHKLTSSRDRTAALASSIPSNVQPQTGEYTKEKLLELQKNARPLGSSMPKPQKSNSHAEPVVVLKGLVKPVPPPPPLPQKEEKEEVEENEERFEKLGLDGKPKISSVIPDQATINAIRAKRERLRQSRGPAPDYISLDSSGVLASRSSGGGSSDDEENDFQGRIALFRDQKDGKAKKGVFEEIDERVDIPVEKVFDDEDEEERRWEEEQFRKGLGKRLDDSSAHVSSSHALQSTPIVAAPSMPYSAVLGSTLANEAMSIPHQAAVATRSLLDNINKLQETHNRTLTSLARNDENLSEALSNITTLENSLEDAGDKYVFMQQLRDFISITCDFLKDKAALIEELEEEMQKLQERRAVAVEERRATDISDENNEIEAAVSAAMSVLSKGSGSAFVAAAASAAQAALVAARETSSLPVQLDEFGRDVNLQNRMDFSRRAEARKRRRSRAEEKRLSFIANSSNEPNQIEGEVSSEDSDSEYTAYQSTWSELLQTAEEIFSDASDEFSKISFVKEKLERWKKEYFPSYRDAYMPLSAPAIFSPYVRLELLKWDPLYKSAEFFDMEWHKVLLDYGCLRGNVDFDPDDADANLIPQLVEKVALPILHHNLAHCWDVFSTRRTKNAIFSTNLIISYVPASSKALQELLEVVFSRLTEAIVNLRVPTWSATVMNVVPGAAQLAAYRFGTSIRLLRNVCLWKDVLALPILEKLAFQELLNGKLLPHVRSIMPSVHDAITKTERIVVSLLGVWYGQNVTADHSQKLQPLVDCVSEIGKKLERRHASGVSEEETLGLARRLKTMLVQLNEYDRARTLLKNFHLKEAL
ncbi:hypothetical protein AXF42_Ash012561 [Apostasia shenzhenica]|uniref:GCF C-terminal domain-containing protein n=1 Tax=Apostasia shenzhenica TaxID=1088818 RepID=A0A2H9ZT13_9ASPA|nr:hypothetical protein AXF42_Ash012561 [Apostasia shenzhenica]